MRCVSVVLCASATIFSACLAIPRELLYPHGTGVDRALPRDQDEAATSEISLQVPIVFYGEAYNSIYVNANGLLSFLTEIPSFFNIQFPLDYPVIAPLYTNVDTRGSGTVFYRETQDESLLQRASESVHQAFSYGADFEARSLFIATWEDVGYHDRGADKVNTFQVVVISDGSDSFVEFLYADNGIQWIQGMAQSSGLPDARAQAGFVSGDGRLYTLRGSGTDQIQNLDKWSNVGVDGVWVFHIGHTGSAGNVMPPDLEVGSESSTTDSCSIGATTCHSKANCVDYQSGGFCCVCQRGYYGNGLNCLKEDIPLRVNGKITGSLNGHDLSQLDLQSYVVTSDGRTYTALSHVSTDIGYDMQPLSLLGGVIGWLFARPVSKAVNGYELTGGVFNHTADITFPQSGHKVTIRQHYYGLDVFDQLRMDTEIRGTLPTIAIGKRIQIADYEEQYTSTSPGLILSQSSLKFQLDGTPVDNPFSIEQVIRYNECQFSPKNISTFRLKVTRNFISYEAHEKIIRYAMTNKVTPLGDEDPCRTGRSKCGEHSSCLVEGDTFRCVCNPGYQYLYGDNEDEESAVCVDINECSAGTHTCDFNAICVNEPGSFACQCKTGYTGDGSHCDKLPSCEDLGCHPDAECIERYPGNLQCRCLPGYTGDGLHCVPLSSRESCDTANDCSPYGACIFSDIVNNYICVCVPGYSGDGYSCYESPTHNETDDGDLPIPSCYFGTCDCPSGYDVQGQICVPKEDISNESTNENEVSCNIVNRCHPHAQCVFISSLGQYQCQCNAGYEGDGYECEEIDISCLQADVCDPHATCTYNEARGKAICICNPGYQGDGMLCTQAGECSSPEDCGSNARCVWSSIHDQYECICDPGYSREGPVCVLLKDSGCNIINDCDANAKCLLDPSSEKHHCRCNAGFSGDGKTCTADPIGCNVINNCHPAADCVYDQGATGYRCRCKKGYHGSGIHCIPDLSCERDPSLCGDDANCILTSTGSYECQCREGYTGDGVVCKATPKYEGNFLLLNQGMATLRIPYNPTPNNPGQPITIQYFQMAIGIDIDCIGGRVYWGDIAGRTIRSSKYDGTDVQDFLTSDIGSPEGISIDWVSRNIYWTDSTKDTLEVANLDKKLRKVIVSEGLVNPRGIAVHPARGKVFWSDWNRESPKLEWANLDGTGRSVFVKGAAVKLPNSLSIDFERDELCWADAGTTSIECVGISTSVRRTVVSNCSYPFGLTISSHNYYWTDWHTQKIESAQRPSGHTNKPISVPLGGSGKMYGIVSVPEYCPRMSNACQFQSASCGEGHLCLPNGTGGRSCVCADADGESSGEADICNDIV
ncbi:nidogen [Periplaneta americana]|uniref:nidogen n=1 Tax=Periplaneta americana TaxID=6978 RepID=UPI0037E75539